jgi:four helix bundle protein
MATIVNFEDLEIWQEARRLYKKILLITNRPNVKKDFKFRDQIKAAAGSVMDNIAEGFERDSRLEFINFLSIAKGSSGEVRSQLFRGLDMDYWREDECSALCQEYKNLATHIANFVKYLNGSEIKGQKFKNRV